MLNLVSRFSGGLVSFRSEVGFGDLEVSSNLEILCGNGHWDQRHRRPWVLSVLPCRCWSSWWASAPFVALWWDHSVPWHADCWLWTCAAAEISMTDVAWKEIPSLMCVPLHQYWQQSAVPRDCIPEQAFCWAWVCISHYPFELSKSI